MVRRDSGEKELAPFKSLTSKVEGILDSIQEDLLKKSRDFLKKIPKKFLIIKNSRI